MLRRKRGACRLALLACLSAGACAALAGCGKGIPGLVPVTGKVFFKGQPFTKEVAPPGQTQQAGPLKGKSLSPKANQTAAFGGVIFIPDTAKGNGTLYQPAGTIDAEGNYQIFTNNQRGAPPGHYLVSVQSMYGMAISANTPPQSSIPLRYADVKTSGLSVEVRDDAPPGSYDLRLEP